MASHDVSQQSSGTPAQYAMRRALHPWMWITVGIILVFMLAMGKVNWAVKAYDHQIELYQVNASER